MAQLTPFAPGVLSRSPLLEPGRPLCPVAHAIAPNAVSVFNDFGPSGPTGTIKWGGAAPIGHGGASDRAWLGDRRRRDAAHGSLMMCNPTFVPLKQFNVVGVCVMKRAGELRQRAERYRRLQRQITDPSAVQAIRDLAGEFEMTAQELERRHQIRERAHEMWTQQGCPQGRDVEFWLAAERELGGVDTSAGADGRHRDASEM